MDGLVIGYLLIEWIGILDRAGFYTGSTAHTFVLYYVSGFLGQGHLEGPCFAFYTVYFSIGQYFNVCLPVDLDQFRREYSHRAVIGGKSLVKLSHMAADGR